MDAGRSARPSEKVLGAPKRRLHLRKRQRPRARGKRGKRGMSRVWLPAARPVAGSQVHAGPKYLQSRTLRSASHDARDRVRP